MEKKKIAFIINPKSGTSGKSTLRTRIEKLIDKEKFAPEFVETRYAGHGKELAGQFATENYAAVVACGGDGTVNEVASSLTETGTAFGIVPLGSGNGLARHLHIPLNVKGAVETINKFNLQPLDYGSVNNRKFFCTCGTGFDARIAWDFSQQGTRGLSTYLKVILEDYWKYSPQTYVIDNGKEKGEERAFLITFANACQYGNDGFIAPHASTMDGVLEMTVIHPFSWYQSPKIGVDLLTEHIDHNKHVSISDVTEVWVRRESAGPIHIDGDPVEEGEMLHVRVFPRAMNVIAGSGAV